MLSYWHRLSFRKVAYSILSVYLVVTCYTGFHLLSRKLQSRAQDQVILDRIKSLSEIADDPDWNPWGEEFESEQGPLLHHDPPALWEMERPLAKRSPLVSRDVANNTATARDHFVVEVWGKAAIGLYLWEHILGGLLESRMNGVWSYGEKTVGQVTFRFRTGPGVVPGKVPRETENLLLVLNGREKAKVETSKLWLDSLTSLSRLRNVAVLMLGNEQCDNSWLYPYLARQGGVVKFVLLVYDSPDVDNDIFFQWPLGVATYRDFPLIDSADLPLNQHRPYMFNFLGTVYKDSSRETLLTAINASAFKNQGIVKPRMQWLPQETEETRSWYTQALSQSDLTLNPVGINTECYRIYEAMAFGSVPVVEDIMTPGYCGDSGPSKLNNLQAQHENKKLNDTVKDSAVLFGMEENLNQISAPLRLLKEFNAPVIYVKNWRTDLEKVLLSEKEMSDYDRSKRREKLVTWYENFKVSMKNRLISILLKKFFHIS